MLFGMSSVAGVEGVGGAVGAALAAALQFFATAQLLLTEPWPPAANVTEGSSYEYLVVGAGTAGALVAARLAATGASVLLLEAGGPPPQEAIIPGFRDFLKGSQYDWNFTTVNDHYSSQALNGGSQKQPRGKLLGGTGSINDMVYARGFPEDYREWAAIAGDDWSWENVLEDFKKTERMTDENIVNDPELMKLHGQGGEIEVSGSSDNHFETEVFLEAFRELGFQTVRDMTSPNKIGAGRFSHTIRDGRRDSSLTALLNKAASERSNLRVLTGALVTKILIENRTAYGMEVLHQNEKVTFFATKEVIVSAGTFNTPKLLLLSGIGPKEHLQALGIEVIQDLPVGENLHDHVMVLNYLAAENGTCHADQSTRLMDVIKYFHDRSGSYSVSNSMGAYLSLDELQPNVPDFAFYPSCLPVNSNFYDKCLTILGFKESICAQLHAANENHEIITVAVVLLKPKSRGVVRLKSTDPLDEPLIYSGTFSDRRDLEAYPDAMNVAHSLAQTGYFAGKSARVIDLDVKECGGRRRRARARCVARALGQSAWHAAGTAALGGALDGRLRVRGLARLRVADASAMPAAPRGNTNAPVVMIAEKAAEFIKLDYHDS